MLDKNYLSIVIINNFTAIFPSIQILSFTTELLHPKFHHLQATNCSHNEQSGKIIAKNVMIQFFRNVWMRSKCREYHRWEDYSREYWLQYRYSKIECCLILGYILFAYQTLEHMYTKDFSQNWKTWTGARFLYNRIRDEFPQIRQFLHYFEIFTQKIKSLILSKNIWKHTFRVRDDYRNSENDG